MFSVVEEICNWSNSRGMASQPVSYQIEAVQGKAQEKHYKAELPMERVMENTHETVEETQWNTLVSYWYSEEAKVILP